MTRKKAILITFVIVGLLLIGSGLWLRDITIPAIKIPEGAPVVYERLDYIMRGEFNHLYIYPDGSIIYIEEKGMRMPTPENPPVRTWKTGKLQPEQLDSLLEFFKNSGLEDLDERYQFPGKPIEGGGLTIGDMGFTISVHFENLNKTVNAFGYLTSDRGETYPDLPRPLNEIYIRLRAISLETKEVAHQRIP